MFAIIPKAKVPLCVASSESWKTRRAAAEKKRQAQIKTLHDQLVTISKNEIAFIKTLSKDTNDRIRDLWREKENNDHTSTSIEISEDYFKND